VKNIGEIYTALKIKYTMALTRLLPAPIQNQSLLGNEDDDDDDDDNALESAYQGMQVAAVGPPPYMRRHGWVPRTPADFGDGGAFPEIMVAQYPLGMGREKKEKSNALPVQMDAQGRIKFDSLLRQGQPKDKVIHSRFDQVVAKQVKANDDPDLMRPDTEKMMEIAEKTRAALELEVNTKIAAAQPTQVAQKQGPAQYIRYTPSQAGVMYNSGSKQRVIRMVEEQKDPMEPPRFKTNKKIPRGPPSPPAPVMHSPTRKVTVKEQQEWKIPPCISNWKNPKGYTIPLDKRLASDGRGLQDPHINDKFAKLAEALYIADRKAREAVETRANLEKKLAQKDKQKKEEDLKKLAEKARQERSGIHAAPKDDDEAKREGVRRDRQKDRERERRLAKAGPDKKSKSSRDKDRDISEKIALGLPNANQSQEALYDQRLFDQDKGMSSGFGDDEAYDVYDKPWRKADAVANIYRPSKNIDQDIYGDDIDNLIKSTNRFVPDKGFEGADPSQSRSGPVQFEREEEEDPFQLDKFLSEAKRGGKRTDTGDKDYEKGAKRPRN